MENLISCNHKEKGQEHDDKLTILFRNRNDAAHMYSDSAKDAWKDER